MAAPSNTGYDLPSASWTDHTGMLRRYVICVYICVLAAWMQFLAPVAAHSMDRPSDPLGVVCGRGAADSDRSNAPAHHRHHGDCCLLCDAYLGAAPLGQRPAFAAFDYPIASPLRWRVVRSAILPLVPRGQRLPRGPPLLV